MAIFISPKNVLCDFLRNRLVDPRARAESSQTQLFDGGSTSFQLVPASGTMSCIQEVYVDAVLQTKYKDYRIDWQNQQVIFYSNTAGGTDNVSVKFKHGTSNWIFPDKADEVLSKTSFPRISLLVVGGAGDRVGQFDSDVESTIHFQIDIWGKEGKENKFIIDGVKYANDKLTEYLGWQIMAAFRSYVEDLHPEFYNYSAVGIPRDMGFDKEIQCFHTIVEAELQGINVSEIN